MLCLNCSKVLLRIQEKCILGHGWTLITFKDLFTLCYISLLQ